MIKFLRISSYIRKPFVIYDFALLHSEFPYIWGKFYFIIYQCREGLLVRNIPALQPDKWYLPGHLYRRILFVAGYSSHLVLNNYLETLTDIWNGMIDRRYPGWDSAPPPPPPLVVKGYRNAWWSDNLTTLLVYLAAWVEDGRAIPNSKNVYVSGIDAFVTLSISNRVVGFAWIWNGHSLLWMSAHRHEIITLTFKRVENIFDIVPYFFYDIFAKGCEFFSCSILPTAVMANPGGFLLFFCVWICKEHRTKQRSTLEVSYVYY